MDNIYNVDIVKLDFTHELDDRYFDYPLIIGCCVLCLLLIILLIVRRFMPLFMFLMIISFAASIGMSYKLSMDNLKTTACIYTFKAGNDRAIEKVEALYGKVTENGDGTYSVTEILNKKGK